MLASLFGNDDNPNEVSETIGGRVSTAPPPRERSEYGFIGLENQGATCYLNSLLQSMYMTPELRHGLFKINPTELGVDQVEEFERNKKKNEESGIVEPDESILSQMKDFGISNEALCKKALIMTKNNFEEALAWYFTHESDAESVIEPAVEETGKKKMKPRLIPLELQNLFTRMKVLNQYALSTEALTSKGFQWQNMEGSVQHDAHELNRKLIEALEKSLKGTSGASLCRNIYQGHLTYLTRCLQCSYKSERGEAFYDLNVQIIDCDNLTKSLRAYCASEVLEGGSAYFCEVCNSKQTAHRCSVINTVPQVLTISLNRFKISKETNWTRQKVTSTSSFPLVLDLNAYVGSSSNVSSPIGFNVDAENSILNDLKSKAIWIESVAIDAIKLASEIIAKYGVNIDFNDLDDDMKSHIDAVILGPFEKHIQKSKTKLYQLSTVIMHRGTAYSGHYFAYIRDHLNEGQWMMPSSAYENSSYINKVQNNSGSSVLKPQYVLVEDGKYYVAESSALAYVIENLEEGAATGDVETNGRPSVSKDKILKDLKAAKGEPWTKIYKPSSGTVSEFFSTHSNLFDFDGLTAYLKPEAIGNLRVISDDKYAKLIKLMEEPKSNDSSMETKDAEMLFNIFHMPTAVASVPSATATPTNAVEKEVDSLEASDEMIARELQATENTKRPVGRPRRVIRPEQKDDDEWQVTTSQRKRNKSNKSVSVKTTVPIPSAISTASNRKSPSSEEELANLNLNDSKLSLSSDVIEEIFNQSEQTQDDPVELQETVKARELAEDILGFYFGRFFEFNDSIVKPMLCKDITQAFQGRDSAYLLVYHAIDEQLPRLYHPTKSSSDSSMTSKSSSKDLIPPPEYYLRSADKFNEDLKLQRTLYETKSKEVKVTIKCPRHICYEYPLVYTSNIETTIDKVGNNHVRSILDGLQGIGCPDGILHGIDLIVDETTTISDICKLLVEQYGDYAYILGLTNVNPNQSDGGNVKKTALKDSKATSNKKINAPITRNGNNKAKASSSPFIDPSSLSVSVLRKYTNDSIEEHAYQLLPPLSDKTTIGDLRNDTNKSGKYLLLWDGKSLPNCDYSDGISDFIPAQSVGGSLVSITTSILCEMSLDTIDNKGPRVLTLDGKKRVIVEKIYEKVSLFPHNMALEEVCQRICNFASINSSRAVIHALIHDANSNTTGKKGRKSGGTPMIVDLTKSEAISSIHTNPDDYQLVILWNKSFVYKPSANKSTVNADNVSVSLSGRPIRQSTAMTPTYRLNDIQGIVEVFIEDIEAKGMQSQYLASLETKQRIDMINIQIILDSSLPKKFHEENRMEISETTSIVDSEATDVSSMDKKQARISTNSIAMTFHCERLCTIKAIKDYCLNEWFGNDSLLDNEYIQQVIPFIHDNPSILSHFVLTESASAISVFDDESVIKDFDFSSHMKFHLLYIKQSEGLTSCRAIRKPLNYDIINNVTVYLISGNDVNASKPNPSQLGEQIGMPLYKIDIDAKEFVIDLKDRLVTALLPHEVSPGWTIPLRLLDIRDIRSHNRYTTKILDDREMVMLSPPPKAYRFRLTNWSGEAADLVDEIDSITNELLTCEELVKAAHQASDGSGSYILHLEEGDVPLRGRMSLQVYLWSSSPVDYSLYDESLKSIDETKETLLEKDIMDTDEMGNVVKCDDDDVMILDNEAASSVSSPPIITEEESNILELISAERRKHLIPLGTVHFHEDNLMSALQEHVYEMFMQQVDAILGMDYHGAIPIDPNHILLRDLSSDMLPSKCYWSSDPLPDPSTVADTPSKVGVKKAVSPAVNQVKTLRKVGIFGSKAERAHAIVIEVLDHPQNISRTSLTATRLWYQVLTNPDESSDLNHDNLNKDSAAVTAMDISSPEDNQMSVTTKMSHALMKPAWPPIIFSINTGQAPQMALLKRQLSDRSGIPFEHIVVFKYFQQQRLWKELIPGMRASAVATTTSKGPKKPILSSTTKKVENIFDAPYSLKEGDLFCVFDKSKLLQSKLLESVGGATGIIVAREEDVIQRKLVEAALLAKKKPKVLYTRRQSARKAAGPSVPKKEILLSIGGDLDFSDDET